MAFKTSRAVKKNAVMAVTDLERKKTDLGKKSKTAPQLFL
jgi:hypothetical protein